MLPNGISQGIRIVAIIGRFMPIHNGHKAFLAKLAAEFDRMIIFIGSCYEAGSARYCITATEREKMIRAVMANLNVSEKRYKILTIPDFETFEEWIKTVVEACQEYGVTHFCTGNKEDILDVLEKEKIELGLEFINPEEDSTFPYHATDIRNMIIQGKYDEFIKLIPEETLPTLLRYTYPEIVAACSDKGMRFIPGRQTVDMILVVKNTTDGKWYVLLGNRLKTETDFPNFLALPGGPIRLYETAINAAIRNFYEETGLKVKILNNRFEPATVTLENVEGSRLEQLSMVGVYGTNDIELNGTKGGSSQVFSIVMETSLDNFPINPHSGLRDVRFYEVNEALGMNLAYEHKKMLQKALFMGKSFPDMVSGR